MKNTGRLYAQIFQWFLQHSNYCDLRHLQTLALMVQGLLASQRLNLTAWEPFVESRAQQAQSYQRRWSRFLRNSRIQVLELYLPLVLHTLSLSKSERIYLAMDTTVLWNQFCMITISVVTCGRAVPLVWHVLEHESASVAFAVYHPLLERVKTELKAYGNIMLLADRGFPNHDFLDWLEHSQWHWCLRVKSDVLLHGPRRLPVEVSMLWPKAGTADCYRQVGLWDDGAHTVNLVLANLPTADEPWAVITDESPTLQTLFEYGKRFDTEQLYLDSKSGAFQLEESRLQQAEQLEKLYLVAAVAILFSTLQGMAVELEGLRRQVDPHWNRGMSYLKIGLNWLHGVIHKGRTLLENMALFLDDPASCFASKKAEQQHQERQEFSRVRTRTCYLRTGTASIP